MNMSVRVVSMLLAGRLECRGSTFWQGQALSPQLAHQIYGPHNLLSNEFQLLFSPELKLADCEACHHIVARLGICGAISPVPHMCLSQ
jgi:hypothetical protein